MREFLPTVEVSRGLGAPVPLPVALDGAIDAIRFTPTGARVPMTWKASLAANYTDGLVVLRYQEGLMLDAPGNPNQATGGIAAISNPAGTVVGMMPHPERLADLNLGSDVGLGVFHSIVSSLAPAKR